MPNTNLENYGRSFIVKLNAPEGHFFICSTIFSVIEFSGVIHGRLRGSKTSPNPLKQIAEWIQSEGFQIIVTSPFEYVLVISFTK
jgi:hypothetical protein